MRKHGWMVFLVVAVTGLLLVYTVTFIVDFKQVAIVKTFGRASEPIDGATRAGLHWKWPWPFQILVRYDTREFFFDDTHEQMLTDDRQTIIMTVFCTWRIQDPVKFMKKIGTVPEAEQRLRMIVRDVKKQVVGNHPLSHFVNVDTDQMKLRPIQDEMLAAASDRAMRDYGVRIVTLGIKSHGLPSKVTKMVIENQMEERNREAQKFRGLGDSVAEAIRGRAEAARKQILEFAKARAAVIRAEGKRAAAELYWRFKPDQQFAMFLRELDTLREILNANTVFLLDPSTHHMFGMMKDGPSLPPLGGAPATQPSRKPAK